jgi:hypoxanthine phosphoribosyltransferase
VIDAREAWQVLQSADRVLDAGQVDAAVDRLAAQITDALADSTPVVVAVMGGGVVFTGQLLPRLRFPLEFDYIHATRYRDTTRGGTIEWKVLPRTPLAGRTVLVLDDILDEGHTLAAIRDRFLADGATRVLNAVFCEKDLGHDKPIRADFVGLTVPDRYVFGFGMDVRGAWRNLPDVYACAD